ncbi:MAG TPA: GNAT family N-acetyltransferase [Puia sp.]|nr:GNAT family N-acetyltransferase [Puia sp.]
MHPLDNPAWSALTTEQANIAVGNDEAKRYAPDILPFAGLARPEAAAAASLDPLFTPGETFYLIGDIPPLPAGWRLENELPCAQLLAPENLHCMQQATEPIVPLGPADRDEMFQLINSTQPGYYHRETRQTGAYFGIRRQGRLVSMAGERMRMTGFSELSAICTDPGFTGHGYAQQLIAWLCRKQVAGGITPFLHVSLVNQRALRLYVHLGFRHRREITFRRIRKTS